MRVSRFIRCLAVTVLCSAAAAQQATPEQRFAEAQAVFEQARQLMQQGPESAAQARRRFHEAARAFAALANDGVASQNLCINTGNAFHFAGDNARALLWYLRAEQLGHSPDALSGIASLRHACRAELWPPRQASIGRILMSWHYDLSRRAKQAILLATYPVGTVLLIVAMFVQRRTVLRRMGIVLMVVGCFIGGSDLVVALGPGQSMAVVLEQTRGYAGDGEGYSVIADPVVAGQEVILLESRGNWIRVQLPSGKMCWVARDICEPV